MKDLQKFIDRLNSKDKPKVLEIIDNIKSGKLAGLNIKKLGGKENMYRVRKMQFRFICAREKDNSLHVVDLSRKDDNTYNF